MFNNISWQGYWTTLALISAIYYLVIYLLYFRRGINLLWNRKPNSKKLGSISTVPALHNKIKEPSENFEQSSLFGDSNKFREPKESDEGLVHACMDELTAFFEESKRSRMVKEELIYSLQVILRKYPTIEASDYKESLTNIIVAQCENSYSIHLSADDVVHVWLGS